jgi:elongation factor 1-gamma
MKLHSPLGNPQATKILVTAKLCGAEVEFPPFDPAILKSKDFGAKSPLKKLPLLETPHGAIAEADAAMRYIARTTNHSLYSGSSEELAEVDTWLDICKSEFEHAITLWVNAVLGHAYQPQELAHATGEVKKILFALEARLKTKRFVALDKLTLADVAFASTLQHAYRLIFDEKFRKPLSHVNAWFSTVTSLPEYEAVAGKQRLCVSELKPLAPAAAPEAPKAAKKEETKHEEAKQKPKPKPKDDDDEDEEHQEKKGPNPLDLLPPSAFVLDDWKRLYANTKNKHEVIGTFWEKYENAGWSIWILKYQKAEGEGQVLYMTNNLLSGFIQRLDHFRRYSFGAFGVYGDEPSLEIQGVLMWRGQELTQELKDHPSFEYYDRTRVDPADAAHRAIVEEYWCNNQENDLVQGRKVREWRSFL